MLFSLLLKNVRDFMKGIRLKILEEMKNYNLIVKQQLVRRHSYDDFFLMNSEF